MKIKKIIRGNKDETKKYSNRNEGAMKSNVISIGSEETPSGARGLAVRKDHEEAVRTFAVESYLLEEMSEQEQTRFEQHCVECVACAEAVEAGRIFISNIVPMPEHAPSMPWFERLFNWLAGATWLKPAALMAALLLPVLGWQQLAISDLTGAHANTVILARGLEKSAAAEKSAYLLTTPSATIEFSITQDLDSPFYRVNISGGQRRSFSQVVPAPGQDAGHRLSIQVPRKTLSSGHFTVLVEGLDREDSRDGHKLDEVYEFDLK
jgi:hypothetical protein